MKNLSLLITCLILSIPCISHGQFGSTVNDSGKTQEKKSYQKIKGNPYLFKDWVKADMLHLEDDSKEDVLIRIDLYQNNIEIKDDGKALVSQNVMEVDGEKFIVLEDRYYNTIIITRNNNPKAFEKVDVDTIYLRKGIHKDHIDNYAIVLYEGKKVSLLKAVDVVYRESKVNTPGKIEVLKKFNRKTEYFLLIEKVKTKVKLKDKNFYKVLGHKDELKAFAKSNKIKLKKESAFVKLLKYWEGLQ